MLVTKRDGTKQELDLNKIHAVITWACEGMNDDNLSPIKGVSVSEIEMKAQLQLFEGMPTKLIHEAVIKAAADCISEDTPNYDQVAARLVWFAVRKEAFGKNIPPTLLEVVKTNIAKGIYTTEILEFYTEDEINYLDSIIEHKRDDLFKYAGAEQMRKKYLAQNRKTKKVFESFQFPYILASAILFAKYPKNTRLKYVKRYYDLISQHYISLPTPIMAGLRTKKKQFSSCFPAGQKVWTKLGVKNIEEIVKGDFVLSDDGQYHRVVETREKLHEDNLFIKIASSFPIKNEFISTADHLIKARILESKYKRTFSQDKWVEAQNLKTGDLIHIPFSKKVNDDLSLNLIDYMKLEKDSHNLYALCDDGFIRKLSKDESSDTLYDSKVQAVKNKIVMNQNIARLLGYFLAEGHLEREKNSFSFTFSTQEQQWHQDVIEILDKEFGLKTSVSDQKDNSTKITVYSKVVKDFIEHMVGNSFNHKILNSYMMELPYEIQKHLLIGVIRGDGCIYKEGMKLSMCNENLIKQLAMISLRNGLYPSLAFRSKESLQKNKEGKKYVTYNGNQTEFISRHDVYTLNMGVAGHLEFFKEVNKNFNRLKKNVRNITRYSRYINGDYYSTVLSTEKIIMEDELVYDLQVETSHSFSVAGISVHNCVLIESGDTLKSINAAASSIVDYASMMAGIGLSIGSIRAEGQPIRNGDAVSTGVIPFAKYFNGALKSCSQGAVRGASATFNYPIWHLEFEKLIELKNNKGTEETRLRTVDYSVHINKVFYERLIKKGQITFFSPEEVPDLYQAFYSSNVKEFEKLYRHYEKDSTKTKKILPAVEVFTKIMSERFETGRIYILNADTVNQHGTFFEPVKMSNLCHEITLPTTPITFPGDKSYNHEESLIALCTLSAINWGKFTPFGDLDIETSTYQKQENRLKDVCEMAVRGLDALLDYQDYPVEAARRHSMRYRPLGIGIIGFAHWLAKGRLYWGEEKTLHEVDTMMEKMAYYLTDTSINLAKEFGSIPVRTKYHDGEFPHQRSNLKTPTQMDWNYLGDKAKKYGIRNATLMAMMPSETSSQLANETNGIEPPKELLTVKGSKDGVLPQIVPDYFRCGAYYQTQWNVSVPDYLKTLAPIQKYADQAISNNTSYDPTKGEIKMSQLLSDLILAYKLGHKTLYYSNTRDGSGDVVVEDDSCAGGACKI